MTHTPNSVGRTPGRTSESARVPLDPLFASMFRALISRIRPHFSAPRRRTAERSRPPPSVFDSMPVSHSDKTQLKTINLCVSYLRSSAAKLPYFRNLLAVRNSSAARSAKTASCRWCVGCIPGCLRADIPAAAQSRGRIRRRCWACRNPDD
jgi:hypothetical protein